MNHMEMRRNQIQIISCMLGLVTLIIIGRIIGDNGIAYLAVTVEALSILTLIFARSVPDALARLLREKNTKSQTKNAERLRKNVMLFQFVIGIMGSVLLFAMSGVLADRVFYMPYSAFILKVISPVVLLRTISSVFLGYFQGSGSQMPTSVVSVIRQVFLLGFSLLFCNILRDYGEKVSTLLRNRDFTSMYAAIGLAIAMILTELLSLFFLLLVYLGNIRRREMGFEKMRVTESFFSSISSLYRYMGSDMLIGFFVRLPLWLGIIFYQRSVPNFYASAVDYGTYYGKYMVICAFPALLCMIFLLPMGAKVNSYLRREEYRLAGEMFGAAVHMGVVSTVFGAVYIAVMSRQIAGGFFIGNAEAVAGMLRIGSGVVLFAVMSYLFVQVLNMGDKNVLVIGAMGIFNIVFILSLLLLLRMASQGITGLVYAGMLGSGVLCLATGFFALRMMRVFIDVIRWVLVPAIAAGIVGIICMLLGNLLAPHMNPLVILLVCLVIGMMFYYTILLLLRSFREQELELMPGGAILIGFARMLRAM